MQKRLAVLLLRVAGAPDQPTRRYAENLFTNAGRGTRNLVDFYDEVSHGRVDLGQSEVFGWMDYNHTNQDLTAEYTKAYDAKKKELLEAKVSEAEAETQARDHAHHTRRDRIVEWGREAAAAEQIDLTRFGGVVCVFNQSVDYFGSPGRTVVHWDASNNHRLLSVDLTGVAHEVGHNLGLHHSRREGAKDEYGDKWDIMSAYDGIHYDTTGTQNPPGSPYYTFGPGLNAAAMDLAGWLDPARVHSGTSGVVTLRPLHRRDLPGWLAARFQLGYSTYYAEFRVKDRWDKRIPAPCVLLHQRSVHPVSGVPCSDLIVARPGSPEFGRPDLREGEFYEIGDALNLFAYYARITVVRIDPVAMVAQLEVRVRERRPIGPQGTIYGGVASDGGGLVWTPGRGFVKVPPRSPLVPILENLAEYETLQTLKDDHSHRVEQLRLESLMRVRDQLSGMIAARQEYHVPAPLTTGRTPIPHAQKATRRTKSARPRRR